MNPVLHILDLRLHILMFHCAFSCCSKVIVSLRYADLVSVLPTRVRVIAWPIDQFKKSEVLGAHPSPTRLSYAEDALKSMSLPEGEVHPKMLSLLFSN